MARELIAGSIAFLGAAILISTAVNTHAGPLDPPAGPVAPSYKTLSEVEPRIAINAVNTPGDSNSVFFITQPGSYYLTGNVQGESGKHGIKISASNVTLDLSGFQLLGVTGSRAGVVSSAELVVIRNGTMRQWGEQGVYVANQTIVENIHVLNSAGDGIYGSGVTHIRNCTVYGGASRGILAFNGSNVSDCTVSACLGVGIEVYGSTISACASSGSSIGIRTLGFTSILDCHAQGNKGDGIRVDGRGLVRGNLSAFNGTTGVGIGIRLTGSDCTVEHNVCLVNDYGISVETIGNMITSNRCSGNTTNFDIVAGNRYGPILDLTPSNGAAMVGNSAPTNLNTTDPWANFAY